MSDAVYFWLQQKVQRYEQDCRHQALQLQRKQTMRDVKYATNVHASPEVRYMPGVKHAEDRLRSAAEKRMAELLSKHLETLAKIDSVDAFEAQRGKYMQQDWCHLRGEFSRVYIEADRSSMKLLHTLQKKLEPTTDPDTPSM